MYSASPADLLRQCEEARAAGLDFPAIWTAILKRHPLVKGMPGHEIRDDGEACIVVQLVTGQKLMSATQGFHLV